MAKAKLEHVNVTVTDPDRAAETLAQIFGWRVRWSGASLHGGRTVHVGGDDTYIALYTLNPQAPVSGECYRTVRGLNHIALVVENIDEIENRVLEAGLEPHLHQEYEPGKRFYFYDADRIEYEVVSYTDE